MGQIYNAECSCGFVAQELYIGFGMINTQVFAVPAACPQCQSLSLESLRNGKRTCRQCKGPLYYLHRKGNFTPAYVLDRFKVPFPWDLEKEHMEPPENIRYRCPKCGKIEMKLVFEGYWD